MDVNQFFSLDSPAPPGHKKTPTNDGTFTFESERFSENCHSTAGAYEETLFNYVKGTQLINKYDLPEINIFEVGFGLGLGPIATFRALKDYPGSLNFYSSELDESLVLWFKNNVNQDAKNIFEFHRLEKTKYPDQLESYVHQIGRRRLEVFTGDLNRIKPKLIKKLKNIHAIYQDPFSPSKNPSLWTTEWFQFLHTISHPQVILSTYSASHLIQRNLTNAGWFLTIAPGFAHKRSSTRATLVNDVYTGPKK